MSFDAFVKWVVIPVLCFDVTCVTIAAFMECRDIWKKK